MSEWPGCQQPGFFFFAASDMAADRMEHRVDRAELDLDQLRPDPVGREFTAGDPPANSAGAHTSVIGGSRQADKLRAISVSAWILAHWNPPKGA